MDLSQIPCEVDMKQSCEDDLTHSWFSARNSPLTQVLSPFHEKSLPYLEEDSGRKQKTLDGPKDGMIQ